MKTRLKRYKNLEGSSPLNKSKRTLYSKGQLGSEREDRKVKTTSTRENSVNTSAEIAPISPVANTLSAGPITDLQIPPPALIVEYLSPPVSITSKNSGTSIASTAVDTVEPIESTITETDDEFLKKPARSSQRFTRKRLQYTTSISTTKTSCREESLDETKGLRRSTRARVGAEQSFLPLLQSLYDKANKKAVKSRRYQRKGGLPSPYLLDAIGTSNVDKPKIQRKQKEYSTLATPKDLRYIQYDLSSSSDTIDSFANVSTFGSARRNYFPSSEERSAKSDVEIAANEGVTKRSEAVDDRGVVGPLPSKITTRVATPFVTKGNINRSSKKTHVLGKIKKPNAGTRTGSGNFATAKTSISERSGVSLPSTSQLHQLDSFPGELNSLTNHVTNASVMAPSTQRTRKVRVRVHRTHLSSNASVYSTTNSEGVHSTLQTTHDPIQQRNEGSEFLSWLKGVTQVHATTREQQVFMDMRYSTADKLGFGNIQGIDYSFYDTVEKSIVGYLRFKPMQVKPTKRAKRYNLHFIVLEGQFYIGTDREHGTFRVGDMVAIKIGCRYKIKNTTNDIALLMVIKK